MSQQLETAQAWYQGVTKDAWKTLIASNLGWIFDGYEVFALVLTAQVALNQILPAADKSNVLFYQGVVIGVSLLGWALGGIMWGIIGDYIGRKPALSQSILIYSIFTGLTFFAGSWQMLALLRFLTGFGLGGEYGVGVSIVNEKWPQHARAKGAAIFQSGIGVGFFVASLVWFLIHGMGPQAWRYMYLVGVLPALLVFILRTSISESTMWSAVKDRREKIQKQATRTEDEEKISRFTLKSLFVEREFRRDIWVTFLMSLATNVAWWGVSTWVPVFAGIMMHARFGLNQLEWVSLAGIAYNGGDIFGLITFGFLADGIGRKPTLLIYFGLSIILVPLLFLGHWSPTVFFILAAIAGFFTAGQYSWFGVYVPELFPTRLRATGVSTVFNVSRFIAFLGPILAGTLISTFHGIPYAATAVGLVFIIGFIACFFARETVGQPLPD